MNVGINQDKPEYITWFYNLRPVLCLITMGRIRMVGNENCSSSETKWDLLTHSETKRDLWYQVITIPWDKAKHVFKIITWISYLILLQMSRILLESYMMNKMWHNRTLVREADKYELTFIKKNNCIPSQYIVSAITRCLQDENSMDSMVMLIYINIPYIKI